MEHKQNRKRPFEGRMLVTDMDGTLLNGKHLVSAENLHALERFTRGGGLFTVATGRMEKTAKTYVANLPVNVPGIIYNGAAIYDFSENSVLWHNCLPDSIKELSQRILDRYGDIGFQVFHGGEIYFVRENAETEKHKIREGFKPIIATLNEVPKPWYKALMAWEPENLAVVEAWLMETGGDFHAVYSEPQFLELLNSSVSKGNALKRLLSLTGLQGIKVTAMGDNLNDMELLQEVDVGIATGNAHELLRKSANLCCCTNDDHAVAEVIGWMEDGII